MKIDHSFDIQHSPILMRLIAEYGLGSREMLRFLMTAPKRYKEYPIAKKNGKGVRHIANPTAELKVFQRWVVENYLNDLPVHKAAMAYESGTSIHQNAQAHAKQKYLMKLDFKNFFPSIKPRDLKAFLEMHSADLGEHDIAVLQYLLFWTPKKTTRVELSIGAPSSPKISNLMMYEFDEIVSRYCNSKQITYTRFADDLTFSTNTAAILYECLDQVRKILKEIKYPRLTLNEEKIVFSSKKYNRRVTGLVLTNAGEVSLGHEKKRLIRATIHHFVLGKLSPEESSKLRGWLGFAHAVEPLFLKRMCEKYGRDAIEAIQSYEPPDNMHELD